MVSGKVEMSRTGLTFRNPVFERAGPDQHHVGTLAPVYPETQGITSRFLRTRIEPLLGLATQVPDRLPPSVREAEGLMPIAEALYQVHVPDSLETAARARERIAFEELFLLQVAAERARRRRMSGPGVIVALRHRGGASRSSRRCPSSSPTGSASPGTRSSPTLPRPAR